MGQDSDKNMPKLQYILPAGRQEQNISPLPEYYCWKPPIFSADIVFSKQICI